MESVSTILYKVNFDEINKLPPAYAVLQYNTVSKKYRLLMARIDYFPIMPKFEYYLFQAPPLPKLQLTNEVVQV